MERIINELKTLKNITHDIATGKRDTTSGYQVGFKKMNRGELMEEAERVESRIGKLIEYLFYATSASAKMSENQIKKTEQRIAELEEFVSEVASGPYHDSDPVSLLETLQRRAMRLSAQQQNAAELLPPICPWCMTAHKPKENPKCLK